MLNIQKKLHIKKESGYVDEAREEEMKKFWWSINSDNFTLMYGQEMDTLANQKTSAEEAERSAGEAQEV